MTQALAYGFPPSSDNGSNELQSYGHDANFNVTHDSRPPSTLSVNMLNTADRQAPSSEPNVEAAVRQNGGGLQGQPMYHQDNAAISRPGNTEYDNFLAITGLGVKMASQGSESASRLSLGNELDRLKNQPNQGIPASLQEYLNGMARPPSSGQILNLHSRLPPPVSNNMFHPELALPPRSSQEQQQNALGNLGNHVLNNNLQHTQPESTAVPPDSGSNAVDEKKDQPLPAPASDIQQLLYNISMPQMNGVSGSSSHTSILNLNGMLPTAGGTSIGDVLAAVQPQPTMLPKTEPKNAEPATTEAPQSGTLNAPVEAGGAKSEAPQLSLKPGISAFAAVADSPLDEDANKVTPVVSEVPAQQETQPATQALPPPQVKPNAIGGPQLAQNLFHPPFPPMASSSSFTAECPPVRPSSAQEGLLSRIPNPEHAALLQQLQQFAPEASNEDLLRALHTHILQQAQLQQRNSAPATPQNGAPASGGLNSVLGASLANHASYPGAGSNANDMLRQGMLTRGGLPQQQLNRQLYLGQVLGQMSGQVGGRATPPAGLQPPFQGLAERALAGMEPYNTAQPKPQATTQQMRFGGNIGVHAINRTSGAPLNNPSQQLLQQPGVGLSAQGMGGMGGLNALGGINNPLTGLPGASRPAVRPPSWQRAQALAQQAAQAQAQQQAAIKMAAARAEAQRQAQLQAAQQQNRQNFLAGLTPAQVQLLMNAPAHQVNALAAQLGMLDTSARPGNLPGNLGAPAPSLTANQALLQQQKLAAARANFASQQAQRASPNPMLGLQQQQQPMLGLQQARQGARNIPGGVNNFGALGVGNPPLNMAPQPVQVGAPATQSAPRTNVVEMGRYLAQNGISVEQAVNSGILGGFSAFDVRALSEGHHQELQRLRNVRAQQAAQAAAVSQQQQQQQQLLQQQLLRQNQLQQLQQAQAVQAAQQQAQDIQAAAQNGSDIGSQGVPPSASSVMNLGPGSLGQLFDWGAGQTQQQGLPASQGGNWDQNSMRSILGNPIGNALHPQLSGSANALNGLVGGLQGPTLARNPSDAGSDINLNLHTLRSKSPWEGPHGGPLASTQPQSAHSSHATTPRSARPGTMGSLLEVPASGFGAIGQPAAPKYPSQGSLDGEFTGYVKPNPGAHAPIGRGSKTSQNEVPSSVRAFWETGASHPGALSTSIGLDGNKAPGYGCHPSSNTMEPAFDLEAIDAALEAQSSLAAGQSDQRIPLENFRIPASAMQQAIPAPADLNSFDSDNYSFFNQATLAESAQELHGRSLESDIEDRAGIGNLLDDIGLSDAPTRAFND